MGCGVWGTPPRSLLDVLGSQSLEGSLFEFLMGQSDEIPPVAVLQLICDDDSSHMNGVRHPVQADIQPAAIGYSAVEQLFIVFELHRVDGHVLASWVLLGGGGIGA